MNPLPTVTGHNLVTASYCHRFDLRSFPLLLTVFLRLPLSPPSTICASSTFNMNLRAFFSRAAVTAFNDPLSPYSKISLSIAPALDLPHLFTDSGWRTCLTTLRVSTSCHCRSRLNLAVGYGLCSDVVVGDDWLAMPTGPRGVLFRNTTTPSNPTGQAPATTLVVSRHRFALGFCPSVCTYSPTRILAPQDLSQILRDSIVVARDALSSFLGICRANDMFCIDLLNDRSIFPTNDLPDGRRYIVLIHLLNGKRMSTLHTPSCRVLAHASSLVTHLSHPLRVLLDAYQKKKIGLDVSSPCCTSIGLHATTSRPGRELTPILEQRLRREKHIIECWNVFDILNGFERLGLRSLHYLRVAPPHDIQHDLSTKDPCTMRSFSTSSLPYVGELMARCFTPPALLASRGPIDRKPSISRCTSSTV